MVILTSLFWVIFGIGYVLYRLYKDDPVETKGILGLSCIILIPGLISVIGYYLIFDLKHSNILTDVLGWVLFTLGLCIVPVGVWVEFKAPRPGRYKRVKGLINAFGIPNDNPKAKNLLDDKEPNAPDSEVTFLILCSEGIVSEKCLNRELELRMLGHNVPHNTWIIRLCEALETITPTEEIKNYQSDFLILDILIKEGLAWFPEQFHSPKYLKYRESLQYNEALAKRRNTSFSDEA